MEALKLLDAAPFAPDIVKKLKNAFDETWASLAPTISPDRVGDTRVSLAHAIIAHAASGERDLKALKTAAVYSVRKHSLKCLGDED